MEFLYSDLLTFFDFLLGQHIFCKRVCFEEIDTVMKLGMAHPMGPLQLADFIGLDVCLAILKVLQQGFGTDKYAPCPLLVNMVTAGKLGVKSGEGFYSWKHKTKELFVSEYFK